ncbi:hypothetical protein C8Q78DRAFT_436138 [Trametes maxima]|nr:hypothetical protein C8Q78DRAFT_436138 [Trametes maxima]
MYSLGTHTILAWLTFYTLAYAQAFIHFSGQGCSLTTQRCDCSRKGSQTLSQKLLFAAVAILYLTSTIYWILNIYTLANDVAITETTLFLDATAVGDLQNCFEGNGPVSDPSDAWVTDCISTLTLANDDAAEFSQTKSNTPLLVQCAPTALLTINIIFSDAVVWWRAWVVWSYNRSLLYVGFVLLSATLGLGVNVSRDSCTLYTIGMGTSAKGFLLSGDVVGVASSVVSLINNLVATLLVGIKAWQHRRFLKEHLHHLPGRTRIEQVLVILVESGVVYSLIWIFLTVYQFASVSLGDLDPDVSLALQSFNSTHFFSRGYQVFLKLGYFMECVVPLIGIYPTLVILLVAMQKSHCETHFTYQKTSTALPVAIPLRHMTITGAASPPLEQQSTSPPTFVHDHQKANAVSDSREIPPYSRLARPRRGRALSV